MRKVVYVPLALAALVAVTVAPARAERPIPLVHPDWLQWWMGYGCADAVTQQLADQCTTSAGFGPSLEPPTMENPLNRGFCHEACHKCCEEQENPATGVFEFGCEALFTVLGGGGVEAVAADAFWVAAGEILSHQDPRLGTIWHLIHALHELNHLRLELSDISRMRRELAELQDIHMGVGDAIGEMIVMGADRGWSSRSMETWHALDDLMHSQQGQAAAQYGLETLLGALTFVRLATDKCGVAAEHLTESTCFNQCNARYPRPQGFPNSPGRRNNPNDPTHNGTDGNPWWDVPGLNPSTFPTHCRNEPGGMISIDDDGDGTFDRTVSTDRMTCTVQGTPIAIDPVPPGHNRPGTIPEPDDGPQGNPTSTNGRPSAPLPEGVPDPPPTGTYRWDPGTRVWVPQPDARRIRVPRESYSLGITINACDDAGINPALCTTYVY